VDTFVYTLRKRYRPRLFADTSKMFASLLGSEII
jgi:hypothetical protein